MNTALVIATLLLVVITFLYMLHTKRLADETKKMADMMVRQAEETSKMVDIMSREYELKTSRFIELKPTEKSAGQIILKLFNRGDIPVTIIEVTLEWWFREKPDKAWTFENKDKSGKGEILSKDKPVNIPFVYSVDELRKEEYPKSKNMSREELLSSVTGKLCLFYSDFDGNIHKKIIDIINLMH
jgi:hypothetical protein